MLGTRTRLPDCRPLLADPDDLRLVFQPIVDLAAATVAGYEALARFPGTSGPDVWFAAAAEAGVAAEMEALAISTALAAVPPSTFLTVDVSPHLLGTPVVRAALAGRPDLTRSARRWPSGSTPSCAPIRPAPSSDCSGSKTSPAPAGDAVPRTPTTRSPSMKTFACGDVIPGCSARFSADTEGGIFAQVAGHAADDHGVTDITPELIHAVRQAIR